MNPDLKSVVRLALQLGITAFGGPAAHIAMLREHAVSRKKWLADQEFLDLLGVTNLIPGPNSTEMVMHIGHLRAGWRGLILAGIAFIMPAALITLLLAWLYVEYGSTTEGAWILRGIKPVILAVVAQAVWNLGKTAVKGKLLAAIGVIVFTLYLLGINEIVLLFGGAAVMAIASSAHRAWPRNRGNTAAGIAFLPMQFVPSFMTTDPAISYSAIRLFLSFVKIGAVLYGSGYVLVAFLQNEFVERLAWISQQQLLDAVAVGQFTPGPVFTTATFVGYLIAGVPGAAIATVGIFLPAFIFVAIAQRFMPRLLRLEWVRPLLDGINVAAIGLMAAVGSLLARDAFVDPLTGVVAAMSIVLLIRYKINSALLISGGAVVSVASALVG